MQIRYLWLHGLALSFLDSLRSCWYKGNIMYHLIWTHVENTLHLIQLPNFLYFASFIEQNKNKDVRSQVSIMYPFWILMKTLIWSFHALENQFQQTVTMLFLDVHSSPIKCSSKLRMQQISVNFRCAKQKGYLQSSLFPFYYVCRCIHSMCAC